MSIPNLDHDAAHTKMLKGAVEFFAGQVAAMFKMGRCATCPNCKQSMVNLGFYFTKCLARGLGIEVGGHAVWHDGPPPAGGLPSMPPKGDGEPPSGLN